MSSVKRVAPCDESFAPPSPLRLTPAARGDEGKGKVLKSPIETYYGRTFNSLTVLRLSAGTVVSSLSGTFVDARCACGRVRRRALLKSVKDGGVKACRVCAERTRRERIGARRRASVDDVTPNTYGRFLALFTGREREEYDRLMKRHGRCEECKSEVCASDAVLVVMADRGKPKEVIIDSGYLHERRDFSWQQNG